MGALCSDNGLDTVRFRWRTDNLVYRAFQCRSEGTIEGYRGERFTQTPFGRVGVFPDGLVYLEGRAAAIANYDPKDHSLLPVHCFATAEQVARDIVLSNDADIGSERARLGRVDLASELRFSDPFEGSAFLHSLASIDVPWCKSRVDGRKGRNIETVSFHGTSGHTIYLRAYDKGVESGTAAPGVRIRVERQRRFRKEREPDVSSFSRCDLRKLFVGREFERLVDLPGATVCDVRESLEYLTRLHHAGELSPERYLKLSGYAVVGSYAEMPRSTRQDYESRFRSIGLFIDPSVPESVEVPIGHYLQALASSWEAA